MHPHPFHQNQPREESRPPDPLFPERNAGPVIMGGYADDPDPVTARGDARPSLARGSSFLGFPRLRLY
jgi:hypothetical protein